MMPAMAYRVVLNDKLGGHRRAVTQGEWRRTIKFFIGERTHASRRFATVLAQEFEGRRFRYSCRLSGKLGIQAGDNVPSNIGDCLAAADRACKINFDGVDAGNMVHDRADRTAVVSHRHGYIPL